MASFRPFRPIEDKIVIEKLAVVTFDDEVNEMAFRRYLKKNWESLTLGLKNSTILLMAGIHGKESGVLGEVENIQTLKNQVRILNNYKPKSRCIFDYFLYCSSNRKFFRLIGF